MQVRKLLDEEDAVSPVIGVILMVAITVILAAVIASFVLGLGGNTQQTPQASFTFDYNSHNDGSYGNLTVNHDGGATVRASELIFRGQGFNSSSPAPPFSNDLVIRNANTKWSDAPANAVTANGEKGGDSAVVSGDYARIWVDNDYEIDLVYESTEGDNSATLASDTGPQTS